MLACAAKRATDETLGAQKIEQQGLFGEPSLSGAFEQRTQSYAICSALWSTPETFLTRHCAQHVAPKQGVHVGMPQWREGACKVSTEAKCWVNASSVPSLPDATMMLSSSLAQAAVVRCAKVGSGRTLSSAPFLRPAASALGAAATPLLSRYSSARTLCSECGDAC